MEIHLLNILVVSRLIDCNWNIIYLLQVLLGEKKTENYNHSIMKTVETVEMVFLLSKRTVSNSRGISNTLYS